MIDPEKLNQQLDSVASIREKCWKKMREIDALERSLIINHLWSAAFQGGNCSCEIVWLNGHGNYTNRPPAHPFDRHGLLYRPIRFCILLRRHDKESRNIPLTDLPERAWRLFWPHHWTQPPGRIDSKCTSCEKVYRSRLGDGSVRKGKIQISAGICSECEAEVQQEFDIEMAARRGDK